MSFELSLNEFDAAKLYKIGAYLSDKKNFSEEPPLIIIACEKAEIIPIESLVGCGIAGRGGHAVKLGVISMAMFNFALAFLSADYGVYLSEKDAVMQMQCYERSGQNFDLDMGELDNYGGETVYKSGRISGYEGILEKYLKSEKTKK